MQSANRVVINTGVLYGQMIITMIISLYSSRLVLNALGPVDFGIYNLVAGVIVMLSFLNAAMAVSTQRYLSYYLGEGLPEKLQAVFNTSVVLHFILAIIISALLEFVGIYLFKGILNIPDTSRESAAIIFHMMVISTFFSIISVPYDAILNSHENMITVSIINVCDSFVRLAIAIFITSLVNDKLIIYGASLALLSILTRSVKRIICRIKYKETKINFRKFLNTKLLKEMFSFAGWNFLGSFSMIAKNQGIAVILNLFFGAVINASYAIANQVNTQLQSFSVYMLKALNPQIAISEGSGDRQRMLRLAMMASKFSFLLMSFFAIPLIVEMPYVLSLWLKNVPEYSAEFCCLILIMSLINQLSVGIQSAVQSVGRIKKYQIGVSILLILNLPLAYLFLRNGFKPTSVLFSSIIIELFAFIFRFIASRKLTNMSLKLYINYVVIKPLLIVVGVFMMSYIPRFFLYESFIRFLATFGLSSVSFFLIIKWIGLSKFEMEKISKILKEILNRIFKKTEINCY